MRNSETHKKQINIFGLGASYDLAPELSSMAKQGFYKDSQNMRLSNANELDFSLDRIKGEEERYGVPVNYSGNYTCIGVAEVNYHVVEVWCADNDSAVYFRIDGELMLCDYNNLMELSVSHPLQVHKNDSCNGGEFYFTDNVNSPYIYSIQDIIDKHLAGSQLYKLDFNPLMYQTNLVLPLNAPVFVSLEFVSGAGLPAGEYSYSFRYVDDSGNRTNFSPPTPLIPVVNSLEEGSEQYAYSKTYGASTALANTNYTPKIKFRVDNRLNYKYIEIGRIAWDANQALGYVPIKQYYQIPTELVNGEFSVWEFIDDATYDWIDIVDSESTEQLGAIVTAKSIRYFNGQLVLGNITYASRDIDNNVTFKTDNNELAHPFIDDIGIRAYSDPWNSTYKKQYMSGERYGFGLACYDDQGNISLVIPIEEGALSLKNYQFLNRREQVSTRTLDLSENNWKGVPRAADINNNPGVPVHERMQFVETQPKTGTGLKTLQDSGYSVLYPRYYNDAYTDHDYLINTKVCSEIELVSQNFVSNPDMVEHDYIPEHFSPNIYAHALAVAGIESDSNGNLLLPKWVSAFSIVRTKPAGRVVAQGLSMYAFDDTVSSEGDIILGSYNITDKYLDRTWFFSDDINNGYSVASDNNDVQFVSPVGYFSEVYLNEYEDNFFLQPFCKNCDMILYATQFYTDPLLDSSPNLDHHDYAGSYWTKFGNWRYDHDLHGGSPFTGSDGNKIFSLTSASVPDTFKGSTSARSIYNTLVFSEDVYSQQKPQAVSPGATADVNDTSNQAWQEPFYIANIINDGKNVPDNNIDDYILTGHFQKVSSKIANGNNFPNTIYLVDERWQDCMVNYYSATRSDDDVFVWINDVNTGVEQAWIDVTYKSAVDKTAIYNAIAAGGYTASNGTVCHGVYTSIFDYDYDRDFYIVFDTIAGVDDYYTIPPTGTEVIVKYDNRFPLIVYGGDTVIGRTIFAPVDGESDHNGNPINDCELFAFTGFPYPAVRFNPFYKVMANGAVGNIQGSDVVPIQIIRQMVVMFYAESRSHLPYYYSEYDAGNSCDVGYNGDNFFPQVHYVMRPIKWDSTCENNFSGGSDINPTYKSDYPGESLYWGLGGFRINASSASMNNRDYSQWNSFNTAFSKPQVGFTEKTRFCSRVIWSAKRNINEQNDPNLRTFPSLNVYDISDANQEIKFLYDNDSDKGNNLLALTGSGVCLLLTDKKLISQATGNDLTYLDADKLVSGEYWLSRTIGCSNEMWRGCAEYDNQLFFPNSESVYRLSGLKIDDIGRNNNGSYFSKINPILEDVNIGFTDTVCAVYDVKHCEYWLHIRKNYDVNLSVDRILNLGSPIGSSGIYDYTVSPNEHLIVSSANTEFQLLMPTSGFNEGEVFYVTPIGTECWAHYTYGTGIVSIFHAGTTYMCVFLGGLAKPQWRFEQVDYIRNNGYTYVYNNDIQKQVWTGYNTYFADKMLNVYGNTQKDLGVLLMRDFVTYDTNIGDYINGDTVNGAVSFYVASDPYMTKEFIDQTFNCNQPPTYCDYSNYNNTIPEATQVYFKNYTHGYYTQIPRKQDLDGYRFQGKYLWCNVGCDSIGDWSLSMVESGYKGIR